MKIVIAPDSFKGSVSAREAAEAIAAGLTEVWGDTCQTVLFPIADGGEGTLDALVAPENRRAVTVTGPDFKPVEAVYGYMGDTAVVEMAAAAGLTLVEESRRRAAKATTYGVGELILAALRDGCKQLMLTVGGSATNDGGCGMLAALGGVFRNGAGEAFVPTGGSLGEIEEIDLSGLTPMLKDCRVIIATDVKNPLVGECGATHVYGRQKGANDEELAAMEAGMKHYAELVERMTCKAHWATEGCGAGGGISLPLLAFAGAQIRSGIETVLEVNGFREQLRDADLVITGEGRLDVQSLYGKAISGVTDAAKEAGVPVACFVGCLGDDEQEIRAMGIREIRTVASLAESVEDSMNNAAKYLRRMAKEMARES